MRLGVSLNRNVYIIFQSNSIIINSSTIIINIVRDNLEISVVIVRTDGLEAISL